MSTTAAETFARRLKQERERLGLSQADLALRLSELLGSTVYPTAITKIERLARSVKLEEAVAIAEVLGTPLAVLLVDRDALADEIATAREDLLVAEHARMMVAAQADEFAAEAERLRQLLQRLEASRSD